jgi:hypothetical protein
MKFRRLLFFLLVISCHFTSHAQYFNTGTDPAGIKWLQIKTAKFTLIYPESFGNEGLKYARYLDYSLNKLKSIYPGLKVKIPVIIHNYTAFSNGYVAWAPRRIEMFPTPEQNTIPMDPAEQLTTHELTHVMQMYSLKQGFLKFMTIIGGEQVTGAASIFLPLWFMEGDAVLAESALSASGRGRTAAFQKEMKALVTEEKSLYSYDKMSFGSFRDYTPDIYQFGYQIAAWSASKYGHDVWNKALGYAAKYPFTLDPVLFSFIKSTGQTKGGLYRETFDSLRTIWSKDIARSSPVGYQSINESRKDDYKNYYSPVSVGQDSIIAIKTSLSAPPAFVLLDPELKTEKKIFTPGPVWPWFLSGAGGKIVWVEERPDIRWENRTFSDIRILDVRTGKAIRLSHRSRYLAASLSPDGKLIAAAENSIGNRNRIIIIDASDGTILNTSDVPGNDYPQRPQWSASGDRLTVISLNSDGEGVLSWSPKTGRWQTLIRPGRDDLQSSFLEGDTLFYVSSASGTDNVHALLPDGKTIMVTNSRYGAYDPDLTGNSIFFSNYTLLGYRICRIDKDIRNSTGSGYRMKDSFLISRFDTLNTNEPDTVMKKYTPVPYKKWMHPFKFHSWMPFYADITQIQTDPSSVKPGFTLLSQNTLSTVITSLGYEYSDGRNNFHYRFTWQGWVPVFESGIDYGAAPIVYNMGSSGNQLGQLSPAVDFTNSVSLPLSFSTGRFTQFLYGSLSADYQNNYIYIAETGKYDYGQIQIIPRFYFSNTDMLSVRDIYPRWGQILDISYITYPADKMIYGPLTSLKTTFYFPGLFRSHGIRLRYETDYQSPVKLLLRNLADLPRGYTNIVSLDYKLYSADYVLPLFYPDFSIPMLIYFKRVRGGIFYDYARGNGNIYLNNNGNYYHNYPETFKSFGGEILTDFYLLRLPLMISGGVQAAWKTLNQAPTFQFLLNINIFGMNVSKDRM